MSRKSSKKNTSKSNRVSTSLSEADLNKKIDSSEKHSKASAVEQSKTENKKKNDNKSSKKINLFSKVVKFFKDSANEVKKIVWPTPQATFKNMLVVLVIAAIVGLFVFALDAGLLAILSKFIGVAD